MVQYFTLLILICFGWYTVGTTHAQTTVFPFFEKETPSAGKIENLLSQYNCYCSSTCHNLVLLKFLIFGPIYRRNKSGRLEVHASVLNNLNSVLFQYLQENLKFVGKCPQKQSDLA